MSPYWHCPDTLEELLAEADAHEPCPPYDYANRGDFGPSGYTKACSWFLGIVVSMAIILGAYLTVRIVVWIAQAVAS